jgi:hypothetical protein
VSVAPAIEPQPGQPIDLSRVRISHIHINYVRNGVSNRVGACRGRAPDGRPVGGQSIPASWLDRPLKSWNTAGAAVPKAPAGDETKESVIQRCGWPRRDRPARNEPSTPRDGFPFWNFDQQLVRDEIEIVGGMTGADGMCRPTAYNLFVFVGGRFAGVLSPASMTSRLDSSSGAVRVQPQSLMRTSRAMQFRSALLPLFARDGPVSHRPDGRRACRRAGGRSERAAEHRADTSRSVGFFPPLPIF